MHQSAYFHYQDRYFWDGQIIVEKHGLRALMQLAMRDMHAYQIYRL